VLTIQYISVSNLSGVLKTVQKIKNFLNLGERDGFLWIAGPCLVEGRDITLKTAEKLVQIASKYNLPYIFKSSYRKANRTSISSFSGIGDDEALKILDEVKRTYGCPVLTDVHSVGEAQWASSVVDVIQIPAFLCRQTDIIVASARTGKVVNIKKGQFASATTMIHAARKVLSSGNDMVMITERGNFFGYTDLVVDFRNVIDIMWGGYPVIMDITHSTQKPNIEVGYSGGSRKYAELLGRCAIVSLASGIFMETHPDPSSAMSDKDTQLPLHKVEQIVVNLLKVWECVQSLQYVELQ